MIETCQHESCEADTRVCLRCGEYIPSNCPQPGKVLAGPKPETVTSVLTELLRLYDWRFKLAEREKDPRADEPAFQDESNRLLRQYGSEKKAAWEAARRVLGKE